MSDELRTILKMLKEEKAITGYGLRVGRDELGNFYEIVSDEGSALRIRPASISLSSAELVSQIIYPGGIQVAVVLADEEETYHTFNLPLPWALLLSALIEKFVKEFLDMIDKVTEDLSNAKAVSSAKEEIKFVSESTRKIHEIDDGRGYL